MARSILAPFKKFSAEGATVGRLLAGYSNIEIGLMHCVQVATGDFDTVLKKMFRPRGETKRIDTAEKLAFSEPQIIIATSRFTSRPVDGF
jgi:hypothetical protein